MINYINNWFLKIIIDLLIYMYLCIIIFIRLIFIYKFILVVLIVFEIMILNISMVICLVYGILNLELFIVYYLIFIVCERTLGLTLLVLIVRYHGNEIYYLFNFRKF